MQTTGSSPFIRATPEPLTAREIDREARDIWAQIACDTGTLPRHAERVARLYNVCRDIQVAVAQGARLKTVRQVLDLIALVIARSFGMQSARSA